MRSEITSPSPHHPEGQPEKVDRSRLGFLVAGLAGLASLGGCVVVPARPVGVTVRGRWTWVKGRRVWVY